MKNSFFKTIVFLGILLIIFAFNACKKTDNENTNGIKPSPVKIEVLKPSKLVDALHLAGVVKAVEDANISPEEGGVVKEIIAKKGQYIQKDEVILLLKDEVMKASYEAAEAQYKMAELNVEKQKKVYEEQGISELQYKNLIYTRDAAKANAELMKARYERTKIKSPINGIIENIIPNVGEFVPPGVPIARVVNTSAMKIQVEVPEKYAGSIAYGILASITLDALPGDTLQGRVSFVGSTVSSTNRTLLVEIIVNNPNRKLKPEMIAKVSLLRQIKKDALLLNESFVQLVDRNRQIVYVENGGHAVERVVELGVRQGNVVEIISGLKPGDRVIVSGQQRLINGSPIEIAQ